MRNPAAASLHFRYRAIVLIWGPGEGLLSCPWSLGIEYSGRQLKEGGEEDPSSSWGRRDQVRGPQWQRGGGRDSWRATLQEARDEVQGSLLIRSLRSILIRIPERAPCPSHPHHCPEEVPVTNRAERGGRESPRVWKETLSESQREGRTWNQTDSAPVNPRHRLSLQACRRLWYAEGNYSNKSQPSPAPDTGDPAKGKATKAVYLSLSCPAHSCCALNKKSRGV